MKWFQDKENLNMGDTKRDDVGLREHEQDSDCTLDADLQCVVCGVLHTETCPACGGRGFHDTDCSEVG